MVKKKITIAFLAIFCEYRAHHPKMYEGVQIVAPVLYRHGEPQPFRFNKCLLARAGNLNEKYEAITTEDIRNCY